MTELIQNYSQIEKYEQFIEYNFKHEAILIGFIIYTIVVLLLCLFLNVKRKNEKLEVFGILMILGIMIMAPFQFITRTLKPREIKNITAKEAKIEISQFKEKNYENYMQIMKNIDENKIKPNLEELKAMQKIDALYKRSTDSNYPAYGKLKREKDNLLNTERKN